jgi:hypothetical protein
MGADGCAGREAGVGSWITQQWVPSLGAPSRAGQRGGAYRAYLG